MNAPRTWLVDGIFLFVLLLWIIQLFLVITGIDAYLGGQAGILWPAAITSAVLALINLKLVSYIQD
ncbi:hypothetical protein D3C87_2012420 [compost metagenome]